MKLVVISPENYEPREHAVLAQLLAAGLKRYHVRKPAWDYHALRNYLRVVPEEWRSRLVLHQHHGLANELGCGGMHFKDSKGGARTLGGSRLSESPSANANLFTSRSCHTLETLEAALGHFSSVFFSPVFPSISKFDHLPAVELSDVSALLARRTEPQRTTKVVALGGIKPENCVRALELGFDGVAVLGALWNADRPVTVFEQLQRALTSHVAGAA
ncbi:MAG: thiamine phosphate synthase [Nibricoccus sp.]